MESAPQPLPQLPDSIPRERLRELDDTSLDATVDDLRTAERATLAARAPYDRHLKELRARMAEIATERRRRERAERQAQRRNVREQAASGEMPSLAEALTATESPIPDPLLLAEIRAFLRTGGEVRLGFAGRLGPTAFTDGRHTQTAKTWGEARQLYAQGWEPGTPLVTGLRVHLVGTKVERVVAAEDVVMDVERWKSQNSPRRG